METVYRLRRTYFSPLTGPTVDVHVGSTMERLTGPDPDRPVTLHLSRWVLSPGHSVPVLNFRPRLLKRFSSHLGWRGRRTTRGSEASESTR